MTLQPEYSQGKYYLYRIVNGRIVSGFITKSESRFCAKYREWVHKEELKRKLISN